MRLSPNRGLAIVKRDEPKKESDGGIVLPDSAQNRPQRGTVLAVGPGPVLPSGKEVSPSVSVGQAIIFAPFAGTEVEVDDEDVLVLRHEDILAVVE